jgi:hypothetical protein
VSRALRASLSPTCGRTRLPDFAAQCARGLFTAAALPVYGHRILKNLQEDNMRASWLTLALAVGTAAPAAAQNDVARRSFNFFNNDLIIEVLDRSAGELRVIRGGNGRVDVAARALGGFAGFGLGGIVNDRLRLSAMGAYRVEYIVSVPDNIRLQVQMPNGDLTPAQGGSEATFRWDAMPAEGGGNPPEPAPELPAGTVLTYVNAQTPQVIGFPDVDRVRSIEVRVAGRDFRIASSRPMALSQRATDQIVINVRGDVDPVDLVFFVPPTATRFGIRVGDEVALMAGEGDIESYCAAAQEFTAPDGSHGVRLTPANGRLDCRFGYPTTGPMARS